MITGPDEDLGRNGPLVTRQVEDEAFLGDDSRRTQIVVSAENGGTNGEGFDSMMLLRIVATRFQPREESDRVEIQLPADASSARAFARMVHRVVETAIAEGLTDRLASTIRRGPLELQR